MTLKQWAENGWLRPHTTSRQEINNLLAIVSRDLKDAVAETISPDWRFGIAYNAALKLCTVLLFATGYRPVQSLAHYRTLQAMPLILGENRRQDAVYLDACRMKRNTVEYDSSGAATQADADELIAFTTDLKRDVLGYLLKNHPEFLPSNPK